MSHSDDSNDSLDLSYAPPKFINNSRQRVIFVDFISAIYELVFDVNLQTATVNSNILFFSDSNGFPAISLKQPVTSIQLDGEEIGLEDQDSPDKEASFKILTKSVQPGRHELKIANLITEEGARGLPIQWLSAPNRLHCIFGMSDIHRDGGFLEAYMPSNYEYDHFRMRFSVKIINSTVEHSIFTNGATISTAAGEWNIDYPAFYTTSCPWFHLGPSDEYDLLQSEFASSDGRTIPILVYSTSAQVQRGLELERFKEHAFSVLGELELDFGPFPHDSVTIFATGIGQGGMEYAGATATRLGSLRHELDHSYFARSITPANGDAGWIDEAIASWGDIDYPSFASPPLRMSNMGQRSAYKRTTSRDAYTVGRDFLAHLDFVLRDRGGLRPVLADYAARKQHSTVTAREFQTLVESFYGASLEDLFNKYIYSETPTPFEAGEEDADALNPHHISPEELFDDVFPAIDK
ncbi:MAG: hypothetical protein QNJ54_21790 [Prochloraceae cyanobacterium]|nr:hypothetical protein [Prochloraceae cyanobacterium]